jgi:preprotein translocase SecE subunit
MQRNQKSISLIYLACSFLLWLFARELTQTVWLVAKLPMPADWIVSPPEMVAIGIGLANFVILLRNAQVNAFTNEVITELAKVVWPNGKETVLSTGVVSVLVGICSMILFMFDMLWGSLVRMLYQ